MGTHCSCPLLAPGALSEPELVSNSAVLMFGGIDTTESMISNAALHLLGQVDQLAMVQADPALLDAAIEESVRLEPSAAVVDRYVTGDTELGGVRLRAGALVMVSLAGANRDPVVFCDPDRFDIHRSDLSQHLSFARGPHFCFGAHLARLEARVALRTLLEQLPDLSLVSEEIAAPRGLVFRRPPQVPVRWSPPFGGQSRTTIVS